LKLNITIAIFVEGKFQNETKFISGSRSIQHLVLVLKFAFFFRVCANQYKGTVILITSIYKAIFPPPSPQHKDN
jgi:hypothetical protein